MKKILIALLFLFFVTPVSAHLSGQPPFFKINGTYANLYPVPLSSLYNFDLPQDLAPDNYLVNTDINFELDKNKLPAPPDVVEKTRFDWDFTDGTHAQGLKTTHKFSKIGSYIIKIYADDGTTPKPQLLESVLLNILPSKDYKLPQAKMLINNQESKDPLTDIKTADFKNIISIDGSKSTSQSKITEYFWDFGDQKSASGISQTHLYPADLSQIFVVLRIKDSNGFIADNFVEVQNSQNANPITTTSIPVNTPKKSNQLPYTIAGIVVFIVLVMVLRWLLDHYRGKRQ